AQQILLSPIRPVLSDDHSRNPVEKDGPTAHGAGRKGRIQGGCAVDPRGLPSRAFQGVHFRMQNDTPPLHPPVVAPPKDPALVNQDGADRNSALRQPLAGLLESRPKKVIHDTTFGGSGTLTS